LDRSGEFGFNRGVTSHYRFAGPVVVRLAGSAVAAVGLVVVVTSVLLATAFRGHGLGVLPAVVLVVLLLAGGLLLAVRQAVVVTLAAEGYRVRHVRGAGVREARWTDVEDVAATTVGGARCVVLRLRDGRSTTVPVDVLAGNRDDFVRDLQQHLNTGHGYRPLSGPAR
jgi:hypothetical protein